jgi:hypothetical protein
VLTFVELQCDTALNVRSQGAVFVHCHNAGPAIPTCNMLKLVNRLT